MLSTEKLGFLETIALITIVITNKIILNTAKDIISSTGSSAWINVIYISIVAIIITLLISKLFKHFQGKDILDICSYLGGNPLKLIMGILYISSLLLVPVSVIKNFSDTLQLIYYKTSPLPYIVCFFILGSLIANRYPLKTIAKTNLLIIPIVFVSILIILFSSINSFKIERIYPILGDGFNETFFSGLSNLFSFSGIGYLLFINPFLNNTKDFKKISIISVTISGIYLFLSVICILLSLTYSYYSEEPFSLYLLTRNLNYGKFIQRIDAIFIFIWILATLSYISIAFNFCIYIFKRLTNIQDTICINYTFHLLIFAILIIPTSFATFSNIVISISKYGSLILIFGISIFILFLANFKKKIFAKQKGKLNESIIS